MKVMKIVGIVILAIVVIALSAFAIFWYRNTQWFDKYKKALNKVGARELSATLPSGNVINYGEVKNDKPALLLIHGQMGIWKDYALVMPELSKEWHIYAIDVYGHGKSSHDESLYYLDVNGDDIIWFIDNIIGEPTVVSGHSNGAITAAYVAANGGKKIAGVVLEDPPIFSTDGDRWEESFAYRDTYKSLHDWNLSDKSECWEGYYLRNCRWGQLFMKDSIGKIADYADKYHAKHPDEPVQIGFLPYSMWYIFDFGKDYDFQYGERFYDLTWNHGHKHEDILAKIDVPCVYIHAQEMIAEDGTYMCACLKEQADRAVKCIGDNCKYIETDTSDHVIHTVHSQLYIDAVNSLKK